MAAKRPGRPTKHDWTDKHDICHKLFIEDQKPVKEVIEYFQNTLGINASEVPSAREFARQFQRWNFPTRRDKLSSEDEARLVDRIKELWKDNLNQKQMLDVVVKEGWQIDEPALARLRRKHGVVLRVAAGYSRENMGPGTGKKRKQSEVEDAVAGNQPEITSHNAQQADSTLLPDEAARRAQRLLEIQATSDELFNSKKRRRRIRGFAHLPPDEPGLPPRYKSETSLDECKAFLRLSNDTYKEIRGKFEDICTDMGIIKKRLCKPGQWVDAKNRLIREHVQLSAVLNPVHGNLAERENALEVICADVTKRMRNMQRRIFVKDANNILGLNPEESKELRRQFYEILKADGFQTMLLCGKEHWEELKQQWYNTSELVQRLYAAGLDGEKKKCVDVLIRDAMKRHNDNNVVKIPHLSQQAISYGPGPGPARRTKTTDEGVPSNTDILTAPVLPPPSISAPAIPSPHFELDPALFAAVSPNVATQQPQSQAIPAYFKLSPSSTVLNHSKMWLATLRDTSMQTLHHAALSKSPSSKLVKTFGAMKNADGTEDHFQIDGEDELEAYLDAVRDSGKVIFLVVLNQ